MDDGEKEEEEEARRWSCVLDQSLSLRSCNLTSSPAEFVRRKRTGRRATLRAHKTRRARKKTRRAQTRHVRETESRVCAAARDMACTSQLNDACRNPSLSFPSYHHLAISASVASTSILQIFPSFLALRLRYSFSCGKGWKSNTGFASSCHDLPVAWLISIMAASTEAESCSKQDAAFHLTHVLRGHTSDVSRSSHVLLRR